MQFINPLKIYTQKNPQWAGLRLGTSKVTIGSHGCTISCLSMVQTKFGPDQPYDPGTVNKIFTENNGYANTNLVIWSAIPRLLPNITHLGTRYCVYSPAPTDELGGHLQRGGLALIEVAFLGQAFDPKGNPTNRHWLVANGFDDTGVIKCDPWYGDETNFQARDAQGRFRYGTGNAALDILTIHYLGDATPDQTPVADPPQSPVAKLPVENPVPVEETPVPETPVGSDDLGKGGFNYIPNTGVELRTVILEGAKGEDVVTGAITVPNIPVGTVVDVAGYWISDTRTLARTVYSFEHQTNNGLDVSYFESPTTEIPVEVKPAPAPEPSKSLSLTQLIAEVWARFVAHLISKRKSS